MTVLVTSAAIVSCIAFFMAFGIVLVARHRLLNGPARFFLAVSMLTYSLVGLSNLLEHGGITAVFDPYEDFLEIIFLPFFLFFIYIAVQTRMQQRLAAEEEIQAATLHSIGDGVVGLDVEGRVRWLNEVSTELLGLESELILGKTLAELLSQQDGEPLSVDVVGAIQRHRTVEIPPEARVLRGAGSRRCLDLRVAPVRRSGLGTVCAVAVLRDVTRELEREHEMLEASRIEALAVLAGGIAHDFNNLLMLVSGNLDLVLREKEVPERSQRFLDNANMALDQAVDLVKQLMTFSRREETERLRQPLTPVLQEAALLLHLRRDIDFRLEVEEGLPLLSFDRGQVLQLFNNLVLNGAQAMPEGGAMSLSGRAEEGAIHVVVEDGGCGIPEEVRASLFDPYVTTKETGTGLGLAVAQAVVRNHGGRLEVDSAPGEGTRMHVWLPLDDTERPGVESA